MNSNNHSGFSLVECCVAMLIMMVGLLGLLQAVNLATVHNLGNILRNEAISVADEQMAMAKASVTNTASFSVLSDSGSLVNRSVRNGFGNYSVNRTVTAAGGSSKSIRVSVRVSWRYKGDKQNHIITTMIMDPTTYE